MGASNTPIYDLIELSGLGVNTTYTTTLGGGGDILGYVDDATYTDSHSGNSATNITELNTTADADNGVLTIGGVDYNISLADPDNTNVTITYNGGASSINVSGDSGTTQVTFIQASPTGGGATRYFMVVDDAVGDLPDITSIEVRGLDFTPAGQDLKINVDQNNNVTVCFAAGTLIDTPDGPRAVEDMRAGDLVMTLDHGAQAVLWAGGWNAPLDNAMRLRRNAPVLIRRGALGLGLPARDLMVSPQHRVMIRSKIAARMFGEAELLVPAKKLTDLPGISRKRSLDRVSYVHLLFARHEVIRAEGALTESLLADKTLADSVGEEARAEIAALCLPPMAPARPILDKGPEIKTLLARHKKNGKPLVMTDSGEPRRATTPPLRLVAG